MCLPARYRAIRTGGCLDNLELFGNPIAQMQSCQTIILDILEISASVLPSNLVRAGGGFRFGHTDVIESLCNGTADRTPYLPRGGCKYGVHAHA